MPRRDSAKIKSYYSRKNVVKGYNQRRFRGQGGSYIDKNEVDGNIQLLVKYLKPVKSSKVLDIGAGRGRLSIPLSKKGYDVYCLDSSDGMFQVLNKYFPKNKILLQSAFEKIKSDQKFHAVVGLRFFDHFNIADQKMILSNIYRNLKEGGFIVFCALNHKSVENVLSKIFYFGKVNYYYTDKDYKNMFSSLNLRIKDFDSKFFLPRGIFLYVQTVPLLANFLMMIDNVFSNKFSGSNGLLIYLLQK